jgi:hypothetical protein
MTVPATIRAGDTVTWVEPAALDLEGNAATSVAWAFTTFLRFNAASEGASVTGTARADGGWSMAISATTSAAFNAGIWDWQSRIASGATVITVGSGSVQVLPSLSYAGSPAAFDGRSEAQVELDEVRAAIRKIINKRAKIIVIGIRRYEAADLGQLMQRESQLKAIVAREKAAEKVAAGLGDPRSLYVRFGR